MSGLDKYVEELQAADLKQKATRKGFVQKSFFLKSSLDKRLKKLLQSKGWTLKDFMAHIVESTVKHYEYLGKAEKAEV